MPTPALDATNYDVGPATVSRLRPTHLPSAMEADDVDALPGAMEADDVGREPSRSPIDPVHVSDLIVPSP